MRWSKIKASYDESLTITKFLYFPKTICGETRWLEVATYKKVFKGLDGDFNEKWNFEWVNK